MCECVCVCVCAQGTSDIALNFIVIMITQPWNHSVENLVIVSFPDFCPNDLNLGMGLSIISNWCPPVSEAQDVPHHGHDRQRASVVGSTVKPHLVGGGRGRGEIRSVCMQS